MELIQSWRLRQDISVQESKVAGEERYAYGSPDARLVNLRCFACDDFPLT
jgi:hypothetical protein